MKNNNKILNTEINKETLDKIRKQLEDRKIQIIEDMKEIKTSPDSRVEFPEYGNKSDENAQEIDEYSKNLATDKVLESALRDINNALDRIEKGTYGICKYCKKPINTKRLLARPVASTCVECKTKLQNNI